MKNSIIVRSKTRLVVQGYTQQADINFEETLTPIVSLESIRMLLACLL
jgi:Reverse transcriptase (RNA-dependent DNA polymerase)